MVFFGLAYIFYFFALIFKGIENLTKKQYSIGIMFLLCCWIPIINILIGFTINWD